VRPPRVCTHTAGNTSASVLARMGRSAGVLRPWQAGREASKHVGGPKRSCPWPMTMYGRQLLRHGRGNPDTDPCWHLRVAVKHGAGRWRSMVRGKAHRRRLGSRIAHRTRRWGKLTPWGRSRRQHAARKGHASRTWRTGSAGANLPAGHSKQGVTWQRCSPARKRVQPRNRMRENCTSGSARGASGNRRSYRGECTFDVDSVNKTW
jgi:hypothetical protein